MSISKAIDPARVGISKSLMTTPCARKAWYGESVRDERGRRLSFPLPERVTFGTAVDEGVTYILWHDRKGEPWTVEQAHHDGMDAAHRALGWDLVEDQDAFTIQLANALQLYVTSPDGLARIRELYAEGLRLQGNDGESLRVDDVIGTPDFITDHRVGDLKTWGRRDDAGKVWSSPEMGVYAYLFSAQTGALPESVFYQAYVRVKQPYWLWIEEREHMGALVRFGKETARHWRDLLELGRADLFATDTRYCGECPFRDPMPEVGHDGCAVGALVPRTEEAPA